MVRTYGRLPRLSAFLAILLCAIPVAYSSEEEGPTASEVRAATERYMALAEQGDASAQYMLFYAYQAGMGVEPDNEEALKWLRKSAENDFPDAVIELGLAHLYGTFVTRSESEGLMMLEDAAEAGYDRATLALGAYYLGLERGLKPRDSARAKEYLLASAEAGSIDGFYLLGVMYRHGLEPEAAPGDDLNIDQAVYWYQLAAKQGHLYAMVGLSEMYIMPIFGINDVEQGFFLAKSAQLAGIQEVDPLIQEALLRIDLATEERLTREAEALVESFQSDSQLQGNF